MPNSTKIKRVMQDKQITQLELAKRLGMAQSNMSKLINKSNAREKTILKLCEALECTPNDIM